MNLVFLQAALPLTKTIVGSTVTSYPHVSKLTSHNEQINSIEDLFQALKKHAALGHCLFNGQLKDPLKHESRAGRTIRGTPKEWLVFDFDKVVCDSVEELLPPCAQGVSYVLQRSASMFVDQAKFSGHVFMLLDGQITEDSLKTWFETLNFDNDLLKRQLALTGSKTGLHWPLDRSAAYDSKLIYIAPPRLMNVEPLIKPDEAIQLVKRKKPYLTIPKFEAVSRAIIDAKINALRQEENLPIRQFATKPFLDGELLIDAEKRFITDVKPIGNHYIKFNVGGGDSLGYWMDLRNPIVIRNFKGEPYMLTEEVDPEFFRSIIKQAPRVVLKEPIADGAEVLAFYATNNEASVTTGIWLPLERRLRLDKSSLSAASAWLAAFGIMKHGAFEHYDLIFDPTDERQYVAGMPTINTFRATDFMVQPKKNTTPSTVKDITPIIGKTMRSMLGDTDGTLLGPFMNWLAFIFQTKQKSEMAWVLHGVEGTGKGKFVEFVLRPLFGKDLVKNVNYSLVQTPFNAWMDNALFVIFEEATISAVDNQNDLMMKLKHWIADHQIEIHGKGKNAVEKPNFTNFIFYSNLRNPVVIAESNRRFNIAHRQETRLFYTPNEYLTLSLGHELKAFADVLNRWPVDAEAVRTLVQTADAIAMHEQTTPIGQQIAEAILQGNLQFFIDHQPSEHEAQGDFGQKFNTLGMYTAFIDDVLTGKKDVTSGDDMYILFRTLMPDPRYFQEAKMWRNRYFAGLGLILEPIWSASARQAVRGMKINWKPPSRKNAKPKRLAANVIELPQRGKK